ncbi:hypothetical protein CMUS01_01994 [Colletotrichum musicola]|uniref:Uncharacterized protein n=1 Tax=Colletotrichum musicola TaxID=2175873 RepID=A0A8H6U7I4_9PEZI|nr:hypothetical protein CMUS01_01994 [Colletotrichum musicola]
MPWQSRPLPINRRSQDNQGSALDLALGMTVRCARAAVEQTLAGVGRLFKFCISGAVVSSGGVPTEGNVVKSFDRPMILNCPSSPVPPRIIVTSTSHPPSTLDSTSLYDCIHPSAIAPLLVNSSPSPCHLRLLYPPPPACTHPSTIPSTPIPSHPVPALSRDQATV